MTSFYTIKEVEKITGVPRQIIRSYEEHHAIPTPNRDSSGCKMYSCGHVRSIFILTGSVEKGLCESDAVKLVAASEENAREKALDLLLDEIDEKLESLKNSRKLLREAKRKNKSGLSGIEAVLVPEPYRC